MSKGHRFHPKKFRVSGGEKLKLRKHATQAGEELQDKKRAVEEIANDVSALQDAQQKLFADGNRALLIILQGMDASGKDGLIKHVMGGVNPQGCRVYSFKAPNSEELQHHFLWRPMRYLPERGMMSIFNRSYYEETLVVRVHPEFLEPQKLPPYKKLDDLWEQRYQEIVQFEETLVRHGTGILKFFLHVSKDEQKKRLLERMRVPEKQWKFNERDLVERKLWSEYEAAYEAMLPATSTKNAPWFVIPADDKWYARAAVADIIAEYLESLGLAYPAVNGDRQSHYEQLAQQLEAETSP